MKSSLGLTTHESYPRRGKVVTDPGGQSDRIGPESWGQGSLKPQVNDPVSTVPPATCWLYDNAVKRALMLTSSSSEYWVSRAARPWCCTELVCHSVALLLVFLGLLLRAMWTLFSFALYTGYAAPEIRPLNTQCAGALWRSTGFCRPRARKHVWWQTVKVERGACLLSA